MKKIVRMAMFSLVLASANAWAWGDAGHKTVGAIADRLIRDTNAQKHVEALLLPGENLAQVSVWADCVKGTYCGPLLPEMNDFIAANPQHGEYHYTDVPFQKDHYQDGAVGTHSHDIVQTLKQAIGVLQGKSDEISNPHRFTPRQSLLLIAHLLGDIQQPLHVGAAFLHAKGQFVVPETAAQIDGATIFDTHGGNNLLLENRRYWPARDRQASLPNPPRREGKALHLYWDVTVVENVMDRLNAKSPDELAQVLLAGKPAVAADTGDVAAWPYRWADDALTVSKRAYADMVPGEITQLTDRRGATYNSWFISVPESYSVTTTAVAEAQLLKGGYRLAHLLKAIWP